MPYQFTSLISIATIVTNIPYDLFYVRGSDERLSNSKFNEQKFAFIRYRNLHQDEHLQKPIVDCFLGLLELQMKITGCVKDI